MKTQRTKRIAKKATLLSPPAGETEYETSPDAPYNRKTKRQLGSRANKRSTNPDNVIERTKRYFHSGKKP